MSVPDPAGEVGGPDLYPCLVQFDREDPAGGGAQLVERADPAPPPGFLQAGRVEQPAVDEATDGLGDGRFGEAGGRRQFGPGHPSPLDDLVEQPPVGGLAEDRLGQRPYRPVKTLFRHLLRSLRRSAYISNVLVRSPYQIVLEEPQ